MPPTTVLRVPGLRECLELARPWVVIKRGTKVVAGNRPCFRLAADERVHIEYVDVAGKGHGMPSLRIQATEFGPAIYIDGLYITTVTQIDEEFEGLDAPTLAKRIGERIKEEIVVYRERRSESGITGSVIGAVLLTSAFLVFSVMLWFALRYLLRRADQRIVPCLSG